ncbi:sigma-70 family RNA polymerase sigma factor [Bacillaceae bacterium IKA-2]|nr:sigma-70 family RNA polymerase sigma factor [Bacillaceae bacterium IKA-2]
MVGAPTVGVVLEVNVNEVTFEELVEEFEPLIKKQIKQLQKYELYDDLYQVSLIALWEAKENFDATKGHFPSFAQKHVRGKLLNYLRSEQKFQQRYQVFFDHDALGNIPAPAELKQTAFPIAGLLPLLSKSERIWLTEFYHYGKGPKAIASQYDVSIETVKTWRKRAIMKLQSTLTVNQVLEMIGN